jgi:hypothetical protein
MCTPKHAIKKIPQSIGVTMQAIPAMVSRRGFGGGVVTATPLKNPK